LKQAIARVALRPLRQSVDVLLRASTIDEAQALLYQYVRDGKPLPGPETARLG
jgi:hypothetical protein